MTVPQWLMKKIGTKQNSGMLSQLLTEAKLHTICEEARCPNIDQCFSQGTATFLILGRVCTRNCQFCRVKKASGSSLLLDKDEPRRLAQTVRKLGLKYVVITSVSRDDLWDGGAEHFAQTIREIKALNPAPSVEVLIPDFSGELLALKLVVKEKPEVINHNLETVQRLYPEVRPEANYQRSLGLLKKIKELQPSIFTKSGLMLGLGEEEREVLSTLSDLVKADCEILTLGQYFQPTRRHLPVKQYLLPEQFEFWKMRAEALGFLFVASGSFVRSSYQAAAAYHKVASPVRNFKLL